jgi:hypothetical protein
MIFTALVMSYTCKLYQENIVSIPKLSLLLFWGQSEVIINLTEVCSIVAVNWIRV